MQILKENYDKILGQGKCTLCEFIANSVILCPWHIEIYNNKTFASGLKPVARHFKFCDCGGELRQCDETHQIYCSSCYILYHKDILS